MAKGSSKRTRSTGSVRRLPSGKWQARVYSPAGDRTALDVFPTKAEADRTLRAALVDQMRGSYVDPRHGRVTFESYAASWLEHRPNLRPRTRELDDGRLRNHLLPTLGPVELAKLTPPVVRAWHAKLSNAGTISVTTAAKCYRLLKTILGTAVEDELIPKNPCILKGAGVERSAERPVASIIEVERLVELAEPRFKALVLMATYTALRLGELSATASSSSAQRVDRCDAGTLQHDMARAGPRIRPGRPSLSRLAAHRQHARCDGWREHEGTHGAHGAFVSPCGPGLPTRHRGTRAPHRKTIERHDRRRAQRRSLNRADDGRCTC
jgi:hypothetical protein